MYRPETAGALYRFTHTYLAFIIVAIGMMAGWLYLGLMVADMVQRMDMGQMGPGMALFNEMNMFAGLAPEVRAQLAALCLPLAGESFGMPDLISFSFYDFTMVFIMWLMMVLAMMLPTAYPMLYSYHSRRSDWAVIWVVLGYICVWGVFSFIASALQLALHALGGLNPMMAPALSFFAASVIIVAGFYQFTSFKQACLYRCRVPVIAKAVDASCKSMKSPGKASFEFGLEQGVYCLGCCWVLMCLMFAVGVMNIFWIAILGLVMALEKSYGTRQLSYAIGVLLLIWGGGYLYFATDELPVLQHFIDRLMGT